MIAAAYSVLVGFANLCVLASLRESAFSTQDISRKGAKEKPQSETPPDARFG
jgi:hypothetical protein